MTRDFELYAQEPVEGDEIILGNWVACEDGTEGQVIDIQGDTLTIIKTGAGVQVNITVTQVERVELNAPKSAAVKRWENAVTWKTDVIIVHLCERFKQRDLEQFLEVMDGFERVQHPDHRHTVSDVYEPDGRNYFIAWNEGFCISIQRALAARGIAYEPANIF